MALLRNLLILSIFLNSGILTAQPGKIADSLLNVVKTSKTESQRIKAYGKLTIVVCRSNPDSALKMLDSVTRWTKRSGNIENIAQLLDLKGSILWMTGNLPQAAIEYKKGLAYAREHNLVDRERNVLSNLGALYKYMANYDSAGFYLREALDRAKQVKDNDLVGKIAFDIGSMYLDKGYYQLGSEYLMISKDAVKPGSNTRLEISLALALGTLNRQINDIPTSFKYNMQALDIAVKREELLDLHLIYNNLGLLYWLNIKNFDSAKYYLQLSHNGILKMKNPHMMLTNLVNLGGVELDMRNYAAALQYFREGNQMKISYEIPFRKAALYINMGKVFSKTAKYDSAYFYVRKGLSIAREINALEWLRNAYSNLVDIDTLTGNYRSALQNSILFNMYSDSLSNENVKNRVAEMEIIYQTRQQEKDIENLKEMNQLSKSVIIKQRYLVAAVIMASLFLVTFLIYRDRNRKKLKDLNVQLMQKNDEISDANYVLENQKNELEVLNQTKDKFFSVIAHDLKSPFNSLLGFLEILEHNFKTMDEGEKLEIIKTLNVSAQNTYNLLVNLLDWSRTQRHQIQNNPVPVNIYKILQAALELLSNRILEKKHEIRNLIPGDLQVFADPNLLESMFINLINNSVKFTPSGGTITISCHTLDKHVEVCIEDTGIGIPESAIGNLFTINNGFIRKGTNRELGTGLGLILCKEFITIMGGNLHVESEVNTGTRFYFTVPVS